MAGVRKRDESLAPTIHCSPPDHTAPDRNRRRAGAPTGCGSADRRSPESQQGPPHHSFVSRPDLQPVELEMTQGEAWSDEYADSDEYIFLTPSFDVGAPASAAMILDANGEVVWMDPSKQHPQR